jgi:hypothetical protein
VQFTETGELTPLSPDAALSAKELAGETWHPASTITLTAIEAVPVAAYPALHTNPACSATIATMETTDLESIVLPPLLGLKRELVNRAVSQPMQDRLLLELP